MYTIKAFRKGEDLNPETPLNTTMRIMYCRDNLYTDLQIIIIKNNFSIVIPFVLQTATDYTGGRAYFIVLIIYLFFLYNLFNFLSDIFSIFIIIAIFFVLKKVFYFNFWLWLSLYIDFWWPMKISRILNVALQKY